MAWILYKYPGRAEIFGSVTTLHEPTSPVGFNIGAFGVRQILSISLFKTTMLVGTVSGLWVGFYAAYLGFEDNRKLWAVLSAALYSDVVVGIIP